ncbi:MAG: isocitrate dehydrogenase [Phycisphaerales bacterium]|nr:isocitrate dehydrogenase [Phycisphaerales bacterium]
MRPQVQIALARGDGIGPEIVDATLELFRIAGVLEQIHFVPVEMGRGVFERGNSRGMTDEAIRTVESCGLLFKGPMETPKGGGGKSINVTARKMWGAFANLRHVRNFPGVPTVYTKAGLPVNFYVVRENVEDTYGGVEQRLTPDVVECKRLISAPGSDQVHRFAFETARRIGLRSVTCGHKANIMKMTDGLFLDRFRSVAREYPDLAAGDMIIDALCMNLVIRPQQFEMIVLTNLQGDIVSDLAAGLVGGLGFAPSANVGRLISIFEAVHGTAPDIMGKGIANPTAVLLSGLMLLRHVGLAHQAAQIENALVSALEQGVRTGDFGDRAHPALPTIEFVRQVADRLGESPKTVPPCPVPEQARASFTPPAKPGDNPRISTFASMKTEIAGLDVYVETDMTPAELAARLGPRAEGSPFRLSMLSSRGTQVWPTGSVFTEVVDYYRARFELRPGATAADQAPALALLSRLGESFTIASYGLLRNFDGQRGYSLAQGQ